jgi:hypothetical protein
MVNNTSSVKSSRVDHILAKLSRGGFIENLLGMAFADIMSKQVCGDLFPDHLKQILFGSALSSENSTMATDCTRTDSHIGIASVELDR